MYVICLYAFAINSYKNVSEIVSIGLVLFYGL